MCILVFGSAAWSAGCGKNTAPISAAPAGASSGSYPADNDADCLPDIPLVDQYGHRVSLASFKGRPVLIDFFYADCATACPLLTAKFSAVAKLLGPELGSRVTLLSVTIDPEHDDPADLLKYARSHDADYKGWLFLTGKPIDVVNVLRRYGVRRERNKDGTLSHVATCFLIGPDGRQRRVYDALDVPPATVVADVGRAAARG
jgi:protein SCO1/2